MTARSHPNGAGPVYLDGEMPGTARTREVEAELSMRLRDGSEGEVSPEEEYRATVEDHIYATADRLDENGREVTEEVYIALAHKVVGGLLEREGVSRKDDNSFDISASSTYETGEFDLVPNLLQQVPFITPFAAIESVARIDNNEGLSPFVDKSDSKAVTVNELLMFAQVFEEKILSSIVEEKEKNNG